MLRQDQFWFSILCFSLISQVHTSTRTELIDLTHSFTNTFHKYINIGFGTPISITPYDKLASQPVFSVTTSWGSPYLLVERLSNYGHNIESNPFDVEYDTYSQAEDDRFSDADKTVDMDHPSQQVALYFCDIEDAMSLRDEFLQSEGMQNLDMRITVTSLAHALRHTSCCGNGYVSGRPVDDCTGVLVTQGEGGSTRFKIVPSKRELFYASRCHGKEHLGLTGEVDGYLMTMTMPVIGATIWERRKKALISKLKRRKEYLRKKENVIKEDVSIKSNGNEETHMNGYIGIPVFRCKGLFKKGIGAGFHVNNSTENNALIPMFFSYEDAIDTWRDVQSNFSPSKKFATLSTMPEDPVVNVYNLMDLVTSIDRKRWSEIKKKETILNNRKRHLTNMFKFNRTDVTDEMNDLLFHKSENDVFNRITFIPNRMCLQSKHFISTLGNGKSRLHPMKDWGRSTM